MSEELLATIESGWVWICRKCTNPVTGEKFCILISDTELDPTDCPDDNGERFPAEFKLLERPEGAFER